MARLILASASPTRAAMLRAAGLAIEVAPAAIDEAEVKAALDAEAAPPREVAEALAALKARRGAARHPDAFAIGADQTLSLDGRRLDKPRTRDEAAAQLSALSGRRHDLLSAAVVVGEGVELWRHVGVARLWMRPLSPGFIADYLDMIGEEAFAGPGSYRAEGRGAQLFSRIEGDWFSVLGLPLLPLLDFLRARGEVPA